MLVTYPNELRAIYPSSRFQTLDPLVSMFEQVERGILYQILGSELYEQIKKDYSQLCFENDGIWADRIEDPDTKVFILRACQSVIVYHALRDNVGILSSSLNQGGGFNQASANNYDTLDDKVREELKRDLYHNSLRAVENLLVLLEDDARHEKVYTLLWKKSKYFFLQSQLLIPTAGIMHPYYLDLGSEPHSKFISIISNIFAAQTLRIESRIGTTLMQMLLNGYSAKTENDVSQNQGENTKEENDVFHNGADSTTKEENNVSHNQDENSKTENDVSLNDVESNTKEENDVSQNYTDSNTKEENDVSQNSDELTTKMENKKADILITATEIFRHALACYVRSDMEDNPARQDMYSHRGDQYSNRAVSLFVNAPDLFHDILATDLDADYRKAHNGRGIDDEPNKHEHHHHHKGMLDIGGLCRK